MSKINLTTVCCLYLLPLSASQKMHTLSWCNGNSNEKSSVCKVQCVPHCMELSWQHAVAEESDYRKMSQSPRRRETSLFGRWVPSYAGHSVLKDPCLRMNNVDINMAGERRIGRGSSRSRYVTPVKLVGALPQCCFLWKCNGTEQLLSMITPSCKYMNTVY